jgi:hypothetical protein
MIDIQAADPNNPLEAYLYFKNNAQMLYICLDVPGDTTNDVGDESLVAFDTGHDGAYTAGHDDLFDIGLAATTWHIVSDGAAGNVMDCSPFNPGLPLHSGLAGAMGFGVSPNEQVVPHRIFEYSIPLALILASPGDTIGFGGDGTSWYLAWDQTTLQGDQWPFYRNSPIFIDEYGDLILSGPPARQVPALSLWGTVGMTIVLAGFMVWRLRRRTASL